MLDRLRTSERQFLDLYTALAAGVLRAARTLVQLLEQPEQRHRHSAAITALKNEADRVVREVHLRLHERFRAAIDSADVQRVAAGLADVLGDVDAIARHASALAIDEASPAAHAVHLATILVRSTEHLEQAVTRIEVSSVVLAEAAEIRRAEREGDACYGRAMDALFDGATAPLEVLRWKEIYDLLEHATDACEHASTALERLVLQRA
jgi:uncharacterized protein Yka (UPF0111/DUF47 family)